MLSLAQTCAGNWPCRCPHLELPVVPSQQSLYKGQTNQSKGRIYFSSSHYKSIFGLQSFDRIIQVLLLSDHVWILLSGSQFFKG